MTRIERLEIPKPVKLAVFKRAGGPSHLRCEGCTLPLRGKRFAYDHTIPEWMQNLPPAQRVITADDVKLLGEECCHKPKTAREAGERAHGKRIIEKAAGARPKGRPIPGSRTSAWKRHMDGSVSRR